MGNTYNRVYIWCCKYGENRYCERCANKKLCASKHTGLLNSCLGKLCLYPYLVVPLISARVTLISTRVSDYCQAILLTMGKVIACHQKVDRSLHEYTSHWHDNAHLGDNVLINLLWNPLLPLPALGRTGRTKVGQWACALGLLGKPRTPTPDLQIIIVHKCGFYLRDFDNQQKLYF